MTISKTTLLGAAGEHFVMAQLLRRGFVAALAPQGAPNLDIVVSDVSGAFQRGLQVKSRQNKGADGGWHMGRKHESISSPTLFYCFVDFGSDVDETPTTFVVPSDVVAFVLRDSHAAWLARPGKNGHVRKDSDLRRLRPDYSTVYAPEATKYCDGWLGQYREAWHLLMV